MEGLHACSNTAARTGQEAIRANIGEGQDDEGALHDSRMWQN